MNEGFVWAAMIARNNAKAAERQRVNERRMWLRIIATVVTLLVGILLSIVLEVTGLVSGVVAAIAIALAFGGLCFTAGLVVGKIGKWWCA